MPNSTLAKPQTEEREKSEKKSPFLIFITYEV